MYIYMIVCEFSNVIREFGQGSACVIMCVLQCDAVWCSVLQCAAVCCSVLQSSESLDKALQSWGEPKKDIPTE